jgi:hypothetical protein
VDHWRDNLQFDTLAALGFQSLYHRLQIEDSEMEGTGFCHILSCMHTAMHEVSKLPVKYPQRFAKKIRKEYIGLDVMYIPF